MSNFTPASAATPVGRASVIAAVVALAAVAAQAIALTVNDFFYVVAPAVGLAALVLGVRARWEARATQSRGRLALAAILLGGLMFAQFVVYLIVLGISEL